MKQITLLKFGVIPEMGNLPVITQCEVEEEINLSVTKTKESRSPELVVLAEDVINAAKNYIAAVELTARSHP